MPFRLFLTLVFFSFPTFAEEHPAKVQLLSEFSTITSGQKFYLGWQFHLKKDWHVYWLNPGDSGTAPNLEWLAPSKGVAIGDILWPLPKRINVGPLTNFGYEEEVVFPIPVEMRTDAPTGRVTFKAKARWLVCREECIPGKAEMERTLPIGATAIASPDQKRIQQALSALPTAVQGNAITAYPKTTGWALRGSGVGEPGSTIDFLPLHSSEISHPVVPTASWAEGGRWEVLLTPDPSLSRRLTQIDGLLLFSNQGARHGFLIQAPVAEEPMVSMELLKYALLAFIGGLILNLMPCVFPILSIKILSFVQQARESRSKLRLHGWLFTLGVLISFWILTAALLILRASGKPLGWGFQLQSPQFLFALCTLMFFMAMNLLGFFEIGTKLMGVGSSLSGREGMSGSFFTGVLATIVATPCTAPFMGVAVGFALTQPPVAAFIIFSALGFGMALPYLVLTYLPGLLKWLPKPGRWMETLRQMMAFPLFGTVVLFVWVFGVQTGMDGVARLLAALLLFAFATWLWFRWHTRSKFQFAGRFAAIVAIAAGMLAGMQGAQYRATKGSGLSEERPADTYPVTWEPYTEARLNELRQQKRLVFVDFTAAWCVSCQVNEKLVFGSEAVRKRFADQQVVAMKADWTDGDPAITSFLKKFNRAGVPFYLLYGKSDAPQPLPEVLTPAILLSALDEIK